MKNFVLAALSMVVLAGCGGGDPPLPPGGLPLLLSQFSECRDASRDPTRFNAAARILAASDELSICAPWPAENPADCGDAFKIYSRPFSGICL